MVRVPLFSLLSRGIALVSKGNLFDSVFDVPAVVPNDRRLSEDEPQSAGIVSEFGTTRPESSDQVAPMCGPVKVCPHCEQRKRRYGRGSPAERGQTRPQAAPAASFFLQ
jgi:hypothetical protein